MRRALPAAARWDSTTKRTLFDSDGLVVPVDPTDHMVEMLLGIRDGAASASAVRRNRILAAIGNANDETQRQNIAESETRKTLRSLIDGRAIVLVSVEVSDDGLGWTGIETTYTNLRTGKTRTI